MARVSAWLMMAWHIIVSQSTAYVSTLGGVHSTNLGGKGLTKLGCYSWGSAAAAGVAIPGTPACE